MVLLLVFTAIVGAKSEVARKTLANTLAINDRDGTSVFEEFSLERLSDALAKGRKVLSA